MKFKRITKDDINKSWRNLWALLYAQSGGSMAAEKATLQARIEAAEALLVLWREAWPYIIKSITYLEIKSRQTALRYATRELKSHGEIK